MTPYKAPLRYRIAAEIAALICGGELPAVLLVVLNGRHGVGAAGVMSPGQARQMPDILRSVTAARDGRAPG